MVAGFILATLFAPAVLAYVLRRTRVWWLAAIAIAGVGVYLLLTLDPPREHHSEDYWGAWVDLGNALQKAYAVVMFVYAVVLLLAARAGRKARPEPPPIPPAIVVRD